MNTIKFAKVRDVKSPTRGTAKSAGIDFYIPNDFVETQMSPLESVLIPSGIHVKVPEGYMLMANDKSGICTKFGLKVGAKIVDEDYQGEVHIHLIKATTGLVSLVPGMKIAQFILVPVSYAMPEETDLSDLYESESERGADGFGSTGIL